MKTADTETLCKHCQQRRRNRPRGLCFKCFFCREIREQYPKTHGGNWKFEGQDFNGTAPLGSPTDAEPGTPEKIAVMEGRASSKQALFHPLDPVMEKRKEMGGCGCVHRIAMTIKDRLVAIFRQRDVF